MADLVTNRNNAAPDMAKVVRLRVSQYMTETFASSWQWLTWRIQSLIAHWQKAVRTQLLRDPTYEKLSQGVYADFLNRVDMCYFNIINTKLLAPAGKQFTQMRVHRADSLQYNLNFRLTNALQFTKRRAAVNQQEHNNAGIPTTTISLLSNSQPQWTSTGAPTADSLAAEVSNVIFLRPFGQTWPIDTSKRAECHKTAMQLIQEQYGLLKHLTLLDGEIILRSRVSHALEDNKQRDEASPNNQLPLLDADFIRKAIIDSWQKQDKAINSFFEKAKKITPTDNTEQLKAQNKDDLQSVQSAAKLIKDALDLLQQRPDVLYWARVDASTSVDGNIHAASRKTAAPVVPVSSLPSLDEVDAAINGTAVAPADGGFNVVSSNSYKDDYELKAVQEAYSYYQLQASLPSRQQQQSTMPAPATAGIRQTATAALRNKAELQRNAKSVFDNSVVETLGNKLSPAPSPQPVCQTARPGSARQSARRVGLPCGGCARTCKETAIASSALSHTCCSARMRNRMTADGPTSFVLRAPLS